MSKLKGRGRKTNETHNKIIKDGKNMAHTSQDRYSALVDAQLRNTLVTKDGVIFNNKYEGDPKAGAVKIPVRSLEVSVGDYNKATGGTLTSGTTTYITLTIDKDKYVNELIDNYDAASVPDGIVAQRLDSASYGLANQIDDDGIAALEAGGTTLASTTALTKTTVYEQFVDMRTTLSTNKVPAKGRYAIITPSVYALVLKSPEFISASNLGDSVKATGAVGEIAGFTLYESNNMAATTEIIAGHPEWCTRVPEWEVPVHVQDLNGSGTYIGACAVQGRKIYAHKVTNANAVLVKTKAA